VETARNSPDEEAEAGLAEQEAGLVAAEISDLLDILAHFD
jgi:hypothetical protein